MTNLTIPLNFRALEHKAILPARAHRTDAGLDLFTFGEFVMEPGQTTRLHTNLAVEMPDKLWGLITGRSSTVFKHGMVVIPGVVDPGYKGELMVVVHNVTDQPVRLYDELRLAQFILMTNVNQWYVPKWGETTESSRGANGFGSTGV